MASEAVGPAIHLVEGPVGAGKSTWSAKLALHHRAPVRVVRRNQDQGSTFSMHVPEEFFELASNLWEPLDATEYSERDVRFITSDSDK